MQFEKTEKKPAVIGWTAAAVGAFFVTEWLIHLPLLNVVIHLTQRLSRAASFMTCKRRWRTPL